MSHFRNHLILWVSLAVFLAVGNSLRAGGDIEKNVKFSHVVSKPDAAGKQKVTITITLAEGWHIYANPVDNDLYAGNATKIKAKGAKLKVIYPPGKLKTQLDGKDKVSFLVYTGKVQLVAEIEPTAGADSVQLTVEYSACDGDRCFRTAFKKIKVE